MEHKLSKIPNESSSGGEGGGVIACTALVSLVLSHLYLAYGQRRGLLLPDSAFLGVELKIDFSCLV